MSIKRVGVKWRSTCDRCRASIVLPPMPKLRAYLTLKREGWELDDKRTICPLCTKGKKEQTYVKPIDRGLRVLEDDRDETDD